MAHVNRVLRSIELPDGTRCVDVFIRPRGTFGFEEYRRDAEDRRGWFAIGCHDGREFETEKDALAAAYSAVTWLAEFGTMSGTTHLKR